MYMHVGAHRFPGVDVTVVNYSMWVLGTEL